MNILEFCRRRLSKAAVAPIIFILLASPAVAFQGAVAKQPTASLSASEAQLVKSVNVQTIRDITTRLAEKDMEGRGTATAGGEKAARYLADRFAGLKLKPLGDNGTYLQAVKFKSTQAAPEMALKIGDDSFKFGPDFVVSPPFTTETADVNADVVFVGYGVTSAKFNRDDLAGMDFKGKVVMVTGGRPKNVEEAAWTASINPQVVIGGLLLKGAAGIILTNVGSKDANYPLIADYMSRRRVSLADSPELPFKLPPVLIISDKSAEKIFAGSGATFASTLAKAEAGEVVSKLLSKKAQITLRIRKAEATGSNVVAVVEGSDPKLKEEAVVYSAHYDAWGIANNGDIYAGAADNALGVGQMLAIAEAISKSAVKPRRSTIFLAITGEEHGLLGSEYWVKHPTWPIEKIAADINFDGVGTDIYGPVGGVVGFGNEYSDLGTTLQEVTRAVNLGIVPDPVPEEKVFYRSDHYAFVKRGVPSLMLMGVPAGDMAASMARMRKWLETDYHQPGDIVKPDWNWDGARTVSVAGLLVGLRVSNAENMPAWAASSPFKQVRGYSGPAPAAQ
jgi:Zn-dependent M28 family amino/carboxypeptidase